MTEDKKVCFERVYKIIPNHPKNRLSLLRGKKPIWYKHRNIGSNIIQKEWLDILVYFFDRKVNFDTKSSKTSFSLLIIEKSDISKGGLRPPIIRLRIKIMLANTVPLWHGLVFWIANAIIRINFEDNKYARLLGTSSFRSSIHHEIEITTTSDKLSRQICDWSDLVTTTPACR